MRQLLRRLEESSLYFPEEFKAIWEVFDRHVGDRSSLLYVSQFNWGRERVGTRWLSFNDPKERAAVEGLNIVDRKEVREPGYKRLRKYVLVDYGPPRHAPTLYNGDSDRRMAPGMGTESYRDFGNAIDGMRRPDSQKFVDDLYRAVGMKPGVVIDGGVFGAFNIYMAWVRSPRQKNKAPLPKFFAMCLVYVTDADEAKWHAFDGVLMRFHFNYHMANRGEFTWWAKTGEGKEIIARYEQMRKIDAKRADALWKKHGGDKPQHKM